MKLINKIKYWKIIEELCNDDTSGYLFILSCFVNLIFFSVLYSIILNDSSILVSFVSICSAFLSSVLSMSLLEKNFHSIKSKITKEIKRTEINDTDKKLLIDYIIKSKKYILLFENIKEFNIELQMEIFNNKDVYDTFLYYCSFSKHNTELIYKQIEENIDKYEEKEKIMYLLKRKNTEKTINIKQKMYTIYDKDIIKYENVSQILNVDINKFQKIYLLSKKSVQDIVDNIELIKSSFEENELIIFDIFNEMSIEKKLECLKNEIFSIYTKDKLESMKKTTNENDYLISMYDIYFKELCLLVKEKELKDYYSILSYVFKDVTEKEIKSIQYRSNVLIEDNKNVEHKNIIKI